MRVWKKNMKKLHLARANFKTLVYIHFKSIFVCCQVKKGRNKRECNQWRNNVEIKLWRFIDNIFLYLCVTIKKSFNWKIYIPNYFLIYISLYFEARKKWYLRKLLFFHGSAINHHHRNILVQLQHTIFQPPSWLLPLIMT